MKGWGTAGGGAGTSARLVAAGMLAALALSGCAGAPAPTVLPAEHPANPGAAEAPFTPPADPFAEDAWIAPAPPAGGAMDHGAMDHGPAEHETTYTCPMHPEIQASKAGSCPKCGMELVPADPPEPPHEEPR